MFCITLPIEEAALTSTCVTANLASTTTSRVAMTSFPHPDLV